MTQSLDPQLISNVADIPSQGFDFCGLQLHYYHFAPKGRAKGEPLLLLHANGFPLLTYLPIIQFLQREGYELYGLDFVGHGRSETSSNFSSWYYFRDQILALLERFRGHLGIRRIHVIGHSIGGATAMLASVLERDRGQRTIRSIMLLDPTVISPWIRLMTLLRIIDPSSNSLALQADKRRSRFRSLELVRRSYRMNPLFRNWDQRAFEAYIQAALQLHPEAGFQLGLHPETEARIYRSIDYDHWSWYRRLNLPLLIAIPGHSEVCPPSALWRLADQSSLCMVRFCKKGSHLFPMEQPDWTARQILSFLNLLL